MKTEHTPGPWKRADYGDYSDFDGQCIVVTGDEMRIAVVQGRRELAEANARLIAAAPDLLEALSCAEQILTAIECGHEKPLSSGMVLDRAREALRKARA